jgi:hypothetical protein
MEHLLAEKDEEIKRLNDIIIEKDKKLDEFSRSVLEKCISINKCVLEYEKNSRDMVDIAKCLFYKN